MTPRSATYNKQATGASGPAYVTECKGEGVPVPDSVNDFGLGWNVFGDLEFPFLHPDLDAELWSFEDDDGVCMSLARKSAGGTSQFVEVICMAKASGHTCFFINDDDDTFIADSVPIGMLHGGTHLADPEINTEGVCSDCHAGENPFIVHPDDPMFVGALDLHGPDAFFPDAWPTPIVPVAFVGNPPPLDHLGPVEDPDESGRCDSCHVESAAGRFPLISTDLPGYCESVLRPAVGEQPSIPVPNTMPMPGYGPIGLYADHRDWLLEACDAAPGDGITVPYTPPPHFIVEPPLIDRPFECSKFVTVRSARLTATLELRVNNIVEATEVMEDSDEHIFALDDPLEADDEVKVRQTIGGVTSAFASTEVNDHTEDFPDGMPLPIITPTPIHKCATAIAVRHVPGATVTVQKTGPGSYTTSKTSGASFTRIDLSSAGPFVIGNAFKAKQSLCEPPNLDESLFTAEVDAENGPSPPGKVTFRRPMVNQRFITLDSIVQGSRVRFKELFANPDIVITDRPSVPFRHVYDIDLLDSPVGLVASTDQFSAQQELCGVWSPADSPPPIHSCSTADMIPEIARPHHGDDFVLVLETIPGATLRVFAWNGELGNGVGGTIALTRSLVGGEVVIVTQSLPPCPVVNQGFSIVVAPP